MKLYLIRHGETEANFNATHSGWGDVKLTLRGEAQARRVGKVLEGVHFDKIYSSDLLRARRTRELALPDADAELCTLIREVNVGRLSKRPVADCIAEWGDEYLKNKKAFNFKPYGGESYEEFCGRIREFLSMTENSPYEKVAAFCHGGFIHKTLDVITGVRNESALFACNNCGVTVLEYNGERWRVITWNYTGEL